MTSTRTLVLLALTACWAALVWNGTVAHALRKDFEVAQPSPESDEHPPSDGCYWHVQESTLPLAGIISVGRDCPTANIEVEASARGMQWWIDVDGLLHWQLPPDVTVAAFDLRPSRGGAPAYALFNGADVTLAWRAPAAPATLRAINTTGETPSGQPAVELVLARGASALRLSWKGERVVLPISGNRYGPAYAVLGRDTHPWPPWGTTVRVEVLEFDGTVDIASVRDVIWTKSARDGVSSTVLIAGWVFLVLVMMRCVSLLQQAAQLPTPVPLPSAQARPPRHAKRASK